ncbi:MAG: radical SAM protein [Firmicutes bacterium]|nr:radical SAM protein [Bacillota bacterium]
MNYKNCNLCERKCNINRYEKKGICGATNKLKVARAALHYWEEPCISGNSGSGTIFFSNCNLKCLFCQNKKISTNGFGKKITINRLSDICIELQEKGANNINLVTPTHYVPSIIKGIKKAKKKGLNIPIVYNTSSYETLDTLKSLNKIVDVYLPDLKYKDDTIARNYSNVKNYFTTATRNIDEMYNQVGTPIFNEEGIMIKGIIVRVLLLPGHLEDAKEIIKYLYDKYNNNIYISIMNQYTPVEKIDKYINLNRKVTDKEYDELIEYACDIGIENAFIQEGETQEESFIPNFNKIGV